ncbi:MAG: hypothetical protein JXQ99_04125 [Hyphomicrobiaceae bacterium]
MNDSQEINRRRFFERIGIVALALGGPFAARSIAGLAQSSASNASTESFLAAIGQHRLESATEFAKSFANSRLALMSVYSQVFYPLEIDDQAFVEIISTSQKLFNGDFKDKQDDRHKVAALPAIARLNLLPTLEREQARVIEREIVTDCVFWRNAEVPNVTAGFQRRHALNIFWTAATACLVRNQRNWFRLEADELSNEAVALCQFFLEKDSSELLRPAIAAFQFLLTYERAMNARVANNLVSSSKNLRGLQANILQLIKMEQSETGWFLSLRKIYASVKGWEDVPSQINEVHMKGSHTQAEFVRYTIRSRFESMAHLNTISPSERLFSHDKVNTHRTIAVLGNFGYSTSDIDEALAVDLALSCNRGMTALSLDTWNKERSTFKEGLSSSDEHKESSISDTLKKFIPLRELDEGELYWKIRKYTGNYEQRLQFAAATIGFGVSSANDFRAQWAHDARIHAFDLKNALGREFAQVDKKDIDDRIDEEVESSPLASRLSEIWNDNYAIRDLKPVRLPSGLADSGPDATSEQRSAQTMSPQASTQKRISRAESLKRLTDYMESRTLEELREDQEQVEAETSDLIRSSRPQLRPRRRMGISLEATEGKRISRAESLKRLTDYMESRTLEELREDQEQMEAETSDLIRSSRPQLRPR